MSVSLIMEPFAGMYREETLASLIIDEFCFLEIDELFDRLGLNWEDFRIVAGKNGYLPHDAASKLLGAVELLRAIAQKATHNAPSLPRMARASQKHFC